MTTAPSKLQRHTRKLVWNESECPEAMPRLQAAIDRWVDTPYMVGQKCVGVGVDCVRVLEAILEELYRIEGQFPSVPKIPQDASQHDARAATKITQQLVRRFPYTITRHNNVQPGDVIVIARGRGPGHSAIIGPRPWTAYEAMPPRVCQTGVGCLNNIVRILHPTEKHRWV